MSGLVQRYVSNMYDVVKFIKCTEYEAGWHKLIILGMGLFLNGDGNRPSPYSACAGWNDGASYRCIQSRLLSSG